MSGRWTAWATGPRPATLTRRGRGARREGTGPWRRSIRGRTHAARVAGAGVTLTVASGPIRLAAMSDVSPPASSLARHGTVVARDRLPGLSAELRRHGWERHRRPARDHRAPGPPGARRAVGSTGSGCRRSTRARAWMSATTSGDHSAVDPVLGTEEDFDRLVREAHARGIRVILDLVMNHTSDQHAWFQASRTLAEGPFADYYLWRDPAGRDADGTPLPPNNWLSFFGGSAGSTSLRGTSSTCTRSSSSSPR